MKMTMERLCQLIQLQPEIIKKLEVTASRMDFAQIECDLNRLLDKELAELAYHRLEAAFQDDADHFKMLCCQLECACCTYDGYLEKGIPETIYIDTMKCFPRFIRECEEKNGRMFFDRGWWTYRQLCMSLFRIGALEYQFKNYGGEDVIALHIPSDADLSEESVDVSIEQANQFFAAYYRDYKYCKYTCNSWLLSQALKPLLPEKSNILSFQERFEIVEEDREDQGYLEWLFQVPPDTEHKNLPSVTRLQKKARELLLNGGKIGSAYGIMGRWPALTPQSS